VDRYPNCLFSVYNEAIGATGSSTACIRAPKTIIDKKCDLVFVEYAVNDGDDPANFPCREGLLRMLLAAGIDVVLVYTFSLPMYEYMAKDEMPPSIKMLEQLADHYNISSVWMALRAFREVQRGLMRFEEWLPDNLHPQDRGSYCYAQAVHEYLDVALTGECAAPCLQGDDLPAPISTDRWQFLKHIPLDSIEHTGPWVLDNFPSSSRMDQVLMTNGIGAKLRIPFHGTGLVLFFDFGSMSCEFYQTLDAGEKEAVARERYDWHGTGGWPRIHYVARDLPEGDHVVEIEVKHGLVQPSGTRFVLGDVVVIP